MEFALFLFFLLFTATLTGILSYYINLLFFQKKEVYDREEITRVWEPALSILLSVCESGGNLFMGIGLFITSALFAWAWSLIGGLVGTPHYTHSLGNYFFASPLLFLGFLFGFPYLKEGFSAPGPAKEFFDSGRSVLSGLGLGTWSANLAAWGLYHDFLFLFVLTSGIIVVYPLCYYWNGMAFFGIVIGPRPRISQTFDDDIYADEDASASESDYAYPSQANSMQKNATASQAENSVPDVADVSWDDDPFEGGLGDEAPSLDDFEDPR
jgi:hypothetical protein